MIPGPETEVLFVVDDGVQWFEVRRCLSCGALLDLLDHAMHAELHPEMEEA